MTTQGYFTKKAWIRNSSAKIGQPAKGRINCECGKAPESHFNKTQPNVICNCGVVYSWDGHIISRP